MNKRGQFFLIAALAIIGVMIGLVAIYTSVEVTPKNEKIYDLSKEINFESAAAIDHGTFYSLSKSERDAHIESLTDEYAKSNPRTDFITIYGNTTNLSVISYTSESTGAVGVDLGGSPSQIPLSSNRKTTASLNPDGQKKVTVIIDPNDKNIRYSFDLKSGQTFFIIAKEEKQGERYVAASI